MSKDSSFDIVCKTDLMEVTNAVNQTMAEIKQRFDFKGSNAEVKLDQKENSLALSAESETRLRSVTDILQSKLVKRGISLKALEYGDVEPAGGDTVRQKIKLQQGIPTEKAKEIVKLIKNLKLKVNASIQDEQVRVTAKSRDDLQTVIAAVKKEDLGIDMQFTNYR
ncbi:MAG: YajQ family cyclic di-GMP-binding protein [Nitrospinae bacterium]|nr:YajQ family cyclic di-GMP-binding protein [Nitrospinota bacterium]